MHEMEWLRRIGQTSFRSAIGTLGMTGSLQLNAYAPENLGRPCNHRAFVVRLDKR